MKGAIGGAMFVDFEPDPKHGFNARGQHPEKKKRADLMPEQFQQGNGTAEARGSKMNRQEHAMQRPRRNGSRADEHAGVGGQAESENGGDKGQSAGNEDNERINRGRKRFLVVK